MSSRTRFHKRHGQYRTSRQLRSESLERREVLSAAGLCDGVGDALGNGPQANAGEGQAAQVGSQDCTQSQDGQAAQVRQTGKSQEHHDKMQQKQQEKDCTSNADCPVATELADIEVTDLLHMREEEKLARDVYQTLGDMYGVDLFENIAASEQQHMDSVGQLLEKYGLEDPVGDNGVGVFESTTLQGMYDALIKQGSNSLSDAYQVGITIEELDIEDLQFAIEETTHADIEQVYTHLLNGSQNHLEAFTAALAGTAGTGNGTGSGTGTCTGDGSANTQAGQGGQAEAAGQGGANSQNAAGQNGSNGQQSQTRQAAQQATNQSSQQTQTQQSQQLRDQAFAKLGTEVGDQLRLRKLDRLAKAL
ncbi:ferritin-like domain-containing protein [Aeoliella mucimassa]|uniref:DUF2202 domain-containing protein n=1 Tax=Aeoliella mucimassa TaxID=2527972 RepID=A0A518ALU4_9BACT|nr:DUF2202 domain-containing protein [Aeoliella mucimassa]QDU55702.1 hypothetical protein Pan181_18960 [Aeoliella mucimassa]